MRLICCCWAILFGMPFGFADNGREFSFNADIRPLLSDTCFYCHGPDSAHRQAGLRLDVEEQAKEFAIVPGDPQASELISRITSADPDTQMPPPESGKNLSPEQIERLIEWVKAGAAYEPYWAYVSPKPHPTPSLQADHDWPRDPIDAFVFQKMQARGFSPAEQADRATLIRRLSFDLTGLPPTPQQVDAFVSDQRPQAYSQLADRLLASPAFGERMAMYWLDLVRYADTVGYHGDQDHNASPYRDYVIDAFNQNMPLDRFTVEQIAGDLLSDPSTDQLIATCYNRLLQTSHEGGVQPKEYLAIYAADRVRNLSAVWMGATVGCAQCHDHKYDPYTIEDFYSLAAFFADVDEQQHFKVGTNSLPTKRPPEIEVLHRDQRERLAEIETEIDSLQSAASDLSKQRLQELQTQRDEINASKRLTMITQSVSPREMRVLPSGNWLDDSGPVVTPAVPSFLGSVPASGRRANRLDLANWIMDVEQGVGGLTARVFVNRFWYLMFGRGLSSSLADFGGQGEPPTHPELLDQLAIDFIDSGWDVKALMRRLAMTSTYRQSSVASEDALERDPLNRWFARQSRFRLPAEMVRDNALATSGLLATPIGGPSVKPAQPAGYYRHLNFPVRTYTADPGWQKYRRGVYVHWQRQFLHPMLKAMDAPSREECTAERPRSNTPLEALVMLNDPSMIDAAVMLAARVLEDDLATDEQRIDLLWKWTTSRSANATETQTMLDLLAAETQHYDSDPQAAKLLIGASIDEQHSGRSVPKNQTELVRWAAWTSLSRAALNLYESVSRN